MKSLIRRILVFWLTLLARGVLARYRPRVVAVTGSVGKTSTKEVTAAMLATRYRVRQTEGNYNTEVGVPLTILGMPLPRPWGWPWLLLRSLRLLAGTAEYPEVLVLELAADKPGDMKHLATLVRPDVAMVTNVRNVHREFYDSIDQIADEKGWLVRCLRKDGTAVLNADDPRVRAMRSLTTAKVRLYGEASEAHVRLLGAEHERGGYRTTIALGEREEALRTGVHGKPQLSAIIAGLATADVLEVPPVDSLKAAAKWIPSPGRLRVFEGKDGRTVIDDTYNASPEAVIASLEALQAFPRPRRAVLGDMKELGSESAAGHRAVGKAAAKLVDELVAVGDEAAIIAAAAKEARLAAGSIHLASNALEAAKIVDQLGKGGSLLVKGSQSMYLEQVVAAELKHPRDRARLLQRLNNPWHARRAGVTDWGKRG
ncbi:MAG TPA: Mur ligase family protein [Patescibacteria group bacterium]|jgi:UDP-N-acetylmuramoyl-tripeptide--D-alanyl-D-alanine ligase